MAVKKDLFVKYRTDLVNHYYLILLEMQNLDQLLKQPKSKIQILNIYDNQIEQDCTQVCQVLKDIK